MDELSMLLKTVADLSGINETQSALGRLAKQSAQVGQALIGVGAASAALGAAVLAGVGMAVSAHANLEEMQYSVLKNQELTTAQQAELNQALREADIISGTTSQEFYEVAAAYSSAGVAAEDLADLTMLSAQAQKALDLTSQGVVIAINEARDGFGLAGDELRSYLQTTNLLANSSTANAQNLVEISGRTAALAGTLGLAAEQNLVLNTAFAEAAPSAEIAASAQVRLISTLGNMVNEAPKAQAALGDLGFTVDEFSRMFADDGVAAINAFNVALMDKAPQERLRIMSDLFGNEMSYNSAILKVAANTSKLAEYTRLANDEGAKMAAWQAETSGASELLSSKLQVMQETFTYALADIGSAVAPALIPIVDGLTNLISKIGEFAAANPQVVQAITILGVALVGLGTFFTIVGTAALAVGPIFAGVGLALKSLLLLVSFAAATISAPFLIAVAAVVALGAAIYAIVANWELIVSTAQSVMQRLGSAIQSGLSMARSNLLSFAAYLPGWAGIAANAINLFIQVWPQVSSAVQGAISAVQSTLSGIPSFIMGIASSAGAAAANIGSSIASGLLSSLGAISSAAGQIASTIARVLPGSPVAEGALTVLNRGYAGGQIAQMIADGLTSKSGMVADALSSLFAPSMSAIGGGDLNMGGVSLYATGGGNFNEPIDLLYNKMSDYQRKQQRKKY